VTDDWRELDQPDARTSAVIRAEDELARRKVPIIVCSSELRRRWHDRYSVDATLVPNGFDSSHLAQARNIPLPGKAPHVVYVGTLHRNRLDLALIADLAALPLTIHLVGPDHLSDRERHELSTVGVRLEGPVEPARVVDWLTSADILICPHRVDAFTLSLDAIKAHEYLATDRPVVATRSSGFQDVREPGLAVVDRSDFVKAVEASISPTRPPSLLPPRTGQPTWDDRARDFSTVLARCLQVARQSSTMK
jgi:glycosyltransferase involved in cell wall biosynthesis